MHNKPIDIRQQLLQQQPELWRLLHTRGQWNDARPAEVEERVDATRIQALLSAGALAEAAYGLTEYWGGKRKAALLAMPATRHSLTHLNQARLARKKTRPLKKIRAAVYNRDVVLL